MYHTASPIDPIVTDEKKGFMWLQDEVGSPAIDAFYSTHPIMAPVCPAGYDQSVISYCIL